MPERPRNQPSTWRVWIGAVLGVALILAVGWALIHAAVAIG